MIVSTTRQFSPFMSTQGSNTERTIASRTRCCSIYVRHEWIPGYGIMWRIFTTLTTMLGFSPSFSGKRIITSRSKYVSLWVFFGLFRAQIVACRVRRRPVQIPVFDITVVRTWPWRSQTRILLQRSFVLRDDFQTKTQCWFALSRRRSNIRTS